jgi:hypothetical protein
MVKGAESIGKVRQQSRNIRLFQKTEAGRVRQQVQINEGLVNRRVGGEEFNLPNLPDTLRSLNLGGAKVTSDHVPHLVPLTKHLETSVSSRRRKRVGSVNKFK